MKNNKKGFYFEDYVDSEFASNKKLGNILMRSPHSSANKRSAVAI